MTERSRRRGSRRTVDEWRRTVYAAHRVPDPVKVLLLLLADHMRTDRQVSVPRVELARMLNLSERRVTERVTVARRSGFLATKVRGQKGVTAVYEGVFPDPFSETPTSHLKGAGVSPPDRGFSGTHGGPTTTPTDLPGAVATDDRPEAAGQSNPAPTSPGSQRLSPDHEPLPQPRHGPQPETASGPTETTDRARATEPAHRPACPCPACIAARLATWDVS